jgi:threonine aldolase
MFGMEAGLFSHQGQVWLIKLNIKLHTQLGEQLIADRNTHVYALWRDDGVSFIAAFLVVLLDGNPWNDTAEPVQDDQPEFYTVLWSLVYLKYSQ